MPEQELREQIVALLVEKIGGVFPGQTGIEVALELTDSIIALLPKDEWRTIESAPRDGTAVLISEAGDFIPEIARWHVDLVGWMNEYSDRVSLSPTHWRPLPAPPTLISQQEAERG
jgi:hypothetical protein